VTDAARGDARENDDEAAGHLLDGLERVLRCFGPARAHVTVIGGLVPSLLVPQPDGDRHVGTADIDLCLTVALADGATGYYDEVAEALGHGGFSQSTRPRQAFRWEGFGISVDFLFPAADDDRPLRSLRRGEQWETAALHSLGVGFAALAIPFRHLIEATRERVKFPATVDGARVPDAWVHVAGPSSLAALKAFALSAEGRYKPKDAYDVVWLLDQRGPEEAAVDAVRRVTGRPRAQDELAGALDLLEVQFDVAAPGTAWYANFLANPSDTADDRGARERFAHATVMAFVQAVRRALDSVGP
jgi:hypothetical protein